MYLHLDDRSFALKCIVFVCLIGWGAFGNFVWSNMGHQHIAIHGTAQQKATIKRCVENQGYAHSVTLDDIYYVMYTCRSDEDNQRLRDSIFK